MMRDIVKEPLKQILGIFLSNQRGVYPLEMTSLRSLVNVVAQPLFEVFPQKLSGGVKRFSKRLPEKVIKHGSVESFYAISVL